MAHPKGLLGPDKNKYLFPHFAATVPEHELPSNESYEQNMPPVKNQGNVGTCVTFGVPAAVEAIDGKYGVGLEVLEIAEVGLYSLTKQHYEPNDLQTQGLYIQDALQCLAEVGHVNEKDLPYRDDPNYIIEPVATELIKTDHKIKGFVRVPTDVYHIKAALVAHGPVVIGANWGENWEETDARGFLSADPGAVLGGHCTCIVGYSDKKQAFRVRNSWGKAWGDKGYCWLPYSAVLQITDAYTVAAR